jgi:hypothetical protein
MTMKRSFFAATAVVLFTNALFSQERHNTLRLEFYQQVRLPSMSVFNNDDWSIPAIVEGPYHTDYTRSYFCGAFGFAYEKVLKNGLIVRPRIGMTFRKMEETWYADSHTQHDDGTDDYISYYSFNYQQQHLNSFLGLAKRFPLFSRFSVDLGVDLTWVHYFKAMSIAYGRTEWAPLGTNTGESTEYYETAPVNLFGLGPQLAVNYTIGDHFMLSAGAGSFFTYMEVNGDNTFRTVVHHDDGLNQSDIDISKKRHYKVDQFGWTVISPMISVGYRF